MLTNRIMKVSPSKTMVFSEKARKLKRNGISIMDFTAGEPDFDTPEFICEAAIKAMQDGHTRYTAVSGIPELREAISEKLLKDNHLQYSPEEICIGTGAKQPLFNSLFAVCEEGDEVILPIPCWVSYVEMVHLCGATPVFVECREEDGFQLDLDGIKSAVTDKTKAILINTPNNPTGAVYTREGLTELAELAKEKHFYIISDEVYEKLIFGDVKHVSPAEAGEEAKKWCIIINGMSKAYAMTGWRMGYAAATEEVISAIKAIASHTTGSSNSIAQYAATAALKGNQDCIEIMRTEYSKRRSFIIERMKTMPNVTCVAGDGAFYMLFNIEKLIGGFYGDQEITSSGVFAELLLTEAHVGMVDGDAFFAPGYLRMCFAASMDTIREGLDRMEAFVRKIKISE